MTAEEEILEGAPEEAAQPEKKPRRPRNVKPPAPDSSPLPKKQRGSSRRKKRREPKKKMSASDLSQQFYGIHQLAATLAKDPLLAVSEEAADSVGAAAYDVIDEYDMWWIFAQVPIVELVLALAMAEVPVLLHVLSRRKGVPDAEPEPGQRNLLRVPPPLSRPVGPIITDPVTIIHAADGADHADQIGD